MMVADDHFYLTNTLLRGSTYRHQQQKRKCPKKYQWLTSKNLCVLPLICMSWDRDPLARASMSRLLCCKPVLSKGEVEIF